MSPLTVSVVIPAYNCQSTIQACVECVLRQTYPVQEIIIVNDGSTDDTSSILQSLSGILVIDQSNAGPAVARNAGARRATGDVIFFTDSDCRAHTDWIERAIGGFELDEVSVVSGSYGISNPESLLARCVHQEIRFRHLRLMPRHPRSFGSYNFGVKRAMYEQVGGFDEQYREASGEDNDLSYKILAAGGKIMFESEALVAHEHPVRLGKYLREQFRHGFWRVRMYLNHPGMVTGDDYTFWKDMVEVLLCLIVVPLVIIAGLGFKAGVAGLILVVVVLSLLQLVYAWRMFSGWGERLFGAWMMFLRAFARTAGFVSGALFFLPKHFIK